MNYRRGVFHSHLCHIIFVTVEFRSHVPTRNDYDTSVADIFGDAMLRSRVSPDTTHQWAPYKVKARD